MKVFSKEKFIERMGKEYYNGLMRDNNGKNWVDEADGCEVKDGRVWPFFVVDEWCIEKDESKLEVRKFRCVGYNQGKEKFFTVGKVYEEKDGKMLNDDGYEYGVVFGELPHEWLQMWYKFEEVKEDKKPKLTIKDFIEKKIVIECNDAKTTVARMIVNGKEVKHAKARCCPDDKFNLATGVRIAIDRMFEKK